MAKYIVAAALVFLVLMPPAMAAQGSRVVGCRERCDRDRCDASRAVCERFRKECLAACKEE